MTTINISLPEKLKSDADLLIKKGFYVSFSDLVRDSLRRVIANARYEKIYGETVNEYKKNQATVLKNKADIDNFFKKI